MNNFRARLKPDDMPMTGRLTREGKHRYILDMRFKRSQRYYGWEIISAVNKRDARAQVKRLYPHVTVK